MEKGEWNGVKKVCRIELKDEDDVFWVNKMLSVDIYMSIAHEFEDMQEHSRHETELISIKYEKSDPAYQKYQKYQK